MEGITRTARGAGAFLFVFLYNLTASYAATEYLPDRYFLVPADVNGDRRADAIAQPRQSNDVAAVLLGDGSGDPDLLWQRLEAIDPDLAWEADQAVLLSEDFNGDGRDDILLQGRAPESAQAVLLANAEGRFVAVSQKFHGAYMGFDWAADLRHAVVGDFDGNRQGEVLLRGYSEDDVHAVVRPDAAGVLNTSGPAWIDGYLGHRWNAVDAELHAGDFNGDGRDDVLWRRLAEHARGQESAVAMLLADANGEFTEISQQWDEDFLGAEWDPATHEIRIADINHDGIMDIILRARFDGGTHYLVLGRMDGRLSELALQWQGDASAADAWSAQEIGTAQVLVQAQQTVAPSSPDTSLQTLEPSATTQVSSKLTPAGPLVAGTLPGEFSVDPTGAANYRIPIQVPPGVGGMQPDLAFLYSSRAGNGLLGQGWSLSGLSAITRCPASIAQTGADYIPVRFTKEDRFCLDGQLLKLNGDTHVYGNSGAIYGTEISSFQRVESKGGDNTNTTSYTGPEHFIVKDKAGLIREYGKTSDSNIKLSGSAVTKRWALNKIRDRFGNYIHFEYEHGDKGVMRAYWPKRIAWYNNQNALIGKVELVYGDRPDEIAGYEPFSGDANVAGNSLFKRLTQVKVFARDTAVREYRLEYEQLVPSGLSALASIQLCDASNRCMPATTFDWSGGQRGLEDEESEKLLQDVGGGALALNDMHLGDMNGDGRTDVLHFVDNMLHWIDLATTERHSTGINVEGFRKAEAIVLDYDRDGLSDLLIAGEANPLVNLERRWHLISRDGTGEYVVRDLGIPAHGWNDKPATIDVENDGYPDLLFIHGGQLYFYRNVPGAGFESNSTPISGFPDLSGSQNILPMEFNGDGWTDFLLTSKSDGTDGSIYISDGTNFSRWTYFPGGQTTWFQTEDAIPVDGNGDGLTDLIAKGGALGTDPAKWYTFLNVGGALMVVGERPSTMTDDDYKSTRVVDWNRDGRSDLLRPTDSEFYVEGTLHRVWTAERFNGGGWTSFGGDIWIDDLGTALPLEFDGNGISDLLFHDEGYWKLRAGAGEMPGLLQQARNGLGDRQSVSYSYINRAPNSNGERVYLGSQPGEVSYPHYELNPELQAKLDTGEIRFLAGPVPVVSAIETGTGVKLGNNMEGRIRTTYRYAGAAVNMTGRGFLGFRMLRVRNSNTDIETLNLHRLAFPHTGMVEVALQKAGDTTVEVIEKLIDPRYCDDYDEGSCGFNVDDETTVVGDIVNMTRHSFDAVPASETADGGIFPYVKSTVEENYEFGYEGTGDPPLVRVVETSYTYGPTESGKVTGDPTAIIVKTHDGSGGDLHQVSTANVYGQNDITQHWCLGRLTSSEVTHNGQDYVGDDPDPVATKRATFEYDQAIRFAEEKSCRLNLEVAHAGDPDLSVTRTYQFDAFGNTNLTSVTTRDGTRQTKQEYGYYGLFPRYTENDLGHREYYYWDHRFGTKRASTGPNGLTTLWRRDGFGRLVQEIAPRRNVHTSYEYAFCGSGYDCVSTSAVYYTRTSSSVGIDAYTISEYDSLGREVATRAPDSLGQSVVTTETVFDSLGRPYLVSLPYVNDADRCWQHTVYDLLGRPKVTRSPANDAECANMGSAVIAENQPAAAGGRRTEYVYDGLATTVTGPGGRVKRTVKNVVGQVLSVQENGDPNLITYFDYDAMGNTTTVVPPGGAAVHITYDAAGNKTSMIDPDMGTWTYGYTGFGELDWQLDAEGNRVDMDYDALGRMITRLDIPEGGATQRTDWVYDVGYGAGTGKLAFVSKADGYAETYAYNAYGQPTDTVRLMDGEVYWTSQTYDEKGRPDILVYPDVATFDTDASAPLSVTLTVPPETHGDVEISWTRVNAFATYKLYRSISSTDYDSAAPIYIGPLNAFTDTVTANGTYHYWVDACHGTTCETTGPESTVAKLPPPSPGHLIVEGFDAEQDGTIDLDWPASEGATYYRVHRSDEFMGGFDIGSDVGDMTAYTVNGLSEGTYYFGVSACNADACSKPTYGLNPGVVTYPLPPVSGAPQLIAVAPNIEPNYTGDGIVKLEWPPVSDPALQYYKLERRPVNNAGELGDADRTYQPETPHHVVDDLELTDYRFRVRACKYVNGSEKCGPSSSYSETLHSGLRPSDIASLDNPAISEDGTVVITFENPEDWIADKFTFQEAADDDFTKHVREFELLDVCELIEPPEGPSYTRCNGPTKATVGGATSGEKWYRVQVCNGPYGCSGWTKTLSPTDVQVAPGKPLNLDLPTVSADGSYTFDWEPPANGATISEYRVYESAEYNDFTDPATFGTPIQTGLQQSMSINEKDDGDVYWYGVTACYRGECGAAASGRIQIAFVPDTPDYFTIPSSDTDGSYILGWPIPASSTGITDYVLQESLSPAFDSVTDVQERIGCLREDPDGGCTKEGSTNYADINGRQDETYYYRVKACNSSGCGGWREGSNGLTVAHEPGAPASLTYTNRDTNGAITVSWGAAAANGASSVVYRLQQQKNNGSWTNVGSLTSSTSSSVSGLGNGDYEYRVKACNGTDSSVCSDYTYLARTLEVRYRPSVPSYLSAPGSAHVGATFTVSWGAASGTVTHYQLGYDNGSSAPSDIVYSGGSRSDSVKRTSTGNAYYWVRACNDWSCSSWGHRQGVTIEPPGTPSSIYSPSSSADGTYIVSWGSAGSPVTHYRLYESKNNSSYTLIYSGGNRSESVGNSNGTYEYRVKACYNSYCGSYRSGASTVVYIPDPVEPCYPGDPYCSDPRLAPEDPVTVPMDDTGSSGDGSEATATDGGVTLGDASRAHLTTVGAGPPARLMTTTTATAADADAVHISSTRIVKVANVDNGFRATPPMRPGEFYRSLRVVGSPALHRGAGRRKGANLRAVEDSMHTTTIEPATATGARSSRSTGTLRAQSTTTATANDGRDSSTSRPAPARIIKTAFAANDAFFGSDDTLSAPVEPVAPLRNDPRIQSGDTEEKNTETDSGFTTMKFGLTNEPSGTYAHAVQHVYHEGTGVLIAVRECVANASDSGCDPAQGQVYWEATAFDIAGAVTTARLGNGLTTTRAFDLTAGTLESIETTSASGATVQDLAFTWDIAGNLTQRTDNAFAAISGGGAFVQDFVYDGLYRLTRVTTNYNIDGTNAITRVNRYHANGNIACFNVASDSTCSTTSPDYTYDPAHPHAVTHVDGQLDPYTYDDNGSMLSGPDGRTITWTAFNKVKRIDGNGSYAEFSYDASRARYKQKTPTATTYYAGALYERVIELDSSGNPTGTTHRFHIFAGGSAVAVYSCTTNCGQDPQGSTADGTKDETLYLLRDHLSSITVITDGHGTVQERFTYSAWGVQQRWEPTANGGLGDLIETSSGKQTRGYTGHEMLADLGLINMNGRVYDQHLGRFLSADPFVQFPHSTQGYNRYAYVNNNPLRYTDPSGYSLREYLGSIVRIVGAVVSAVYCGPAASACMAAFGAVAGYLDGGKHGAMRGAVTSGMAAGMASMVGGAYGNIAKSQGHALTNGQLFGKAMTHGVTQGALSTAGGGRFGDGFLGGFAGDLAGSYLPQSGNAVVSTIQAAIVGGTVAKIGGGNFANGAVAGAFAAAFGNAMQSDSGDGSFTLEEWEAASPAERQQMVDLAVSSTEVITDPSTLMAECGGCIRFENMQQQYLRGDITRADLMSYYEATGEGAFIGLSMLPAGRAVTALGGPIGRFLGPKGPVFGNSFYRGTNNSGILNRTHVRVGWSYHAATDRLNFSLRIGRRHWDFFSIKPPPQ